MALQRIVDDCGARDFRIVAIVATAGTTDCGSIDPLDEIAEIAGHAHTHFHVDAAWCAPLIFSQRYHTRLAGIDRAESVTNMLISNSIYRSVAASCVCSNLTPLP